MALSFQSPSAGTFLGWGMSVHLHQSVVPIVDAVLELSIVEMGLVTVCEYPWPHGEADAFPIIGAEGWDFPAKLFAQSLRGYPGTLEIPGIGAAVGDAITLRADYIPVDRLPPTFYNYSATVTVDRSYLWDPSTGVPVLLNLALNRLAGTSSPSGPSGAPSLSTLELSTDRPLALASPFTGQGQLAIAGSSEPAFGMQWQVQDAPPGVGLALGWLAEYEDRVLQMVAYYKLADGSYVADIIASERGAQGIILFDKGQPDHVDYFIAPGFSLNFWWLTAT